MRPKTARNARTADENNWIYLFFGGGFTFELALNRVGLVRLSFVDLLTDVSLFTQGGCITTPKHVYPFGIKKGGFFVHAC